MISVLHKSNRAALTILGTFGYRAAMQFEHDRPQHKKNPQRKSGFAVPECIPFFPLPNVVFFPRTYLPLHIFEPRYRDMVAEAAKKGRCIGMALLKEGWEDEYYGNPTVFSIGCVGRLVSVQQSPDGRSNILLQGLERYEILEELGGKSYRRANIVLKPQDKDATLDGTLRAELTQAFQEFLQEHDDGHDWQALFPVDTNDEVLVNTLSTYLDFTPLEKQFLLEADSLRQQAQRLHALIQFKQHERDGSRGWG